MVITVTSKYDYVFNLFSVNLFKPSAMIFPLRIMQNVNPSAKRKLKYNYVIPKRIIQFISFLSVVFQWQNK